MDTPEFSKQEVVLVVDDTPDNLSLMSELLKDKYRVKLANNGEKALKIASSSNPPDIILLDIMMPLMDGYEVMKRLRTESNTSSIPVIFLTARSEIEDERYGLELGAVDYITKPVSPPIVLARLKTHLALKRARDFLKDKNEYLQAEVRRRTEEIIAIQDVTILALSSLAETRDNDTGNHIRRTQMYIAALCKHLKGHPRFGPLLTDENVDSIYKTAPLHDIGKVGIPDNILLKPGKLTVDEFEIMKKHAVLGKNAIEKAEKRLGMEVDFLKFAK
ncbi:MAG: response regulator, partial [Nitrospirae bacterium]|nr:response regulator [Nitrospirota bacterium]